MKSYIIVLGAVLMTACGQDKEHRKINTNDQQVKTTLSMGDSTKFAFAPDAVDNTKDPVCRMPVKMGISDTVYYMKKVYGFCSIGCKDEFKKDPKAYIKDAKLK